MKKKNTTTVIPYDPTNVSAGEMTYNPLDMSVTKNEVDSYYKPKGRMNCCTARI